MWLSIPVVQFHLVHVGIFNHTWFWVNSKGVFLYKNKVILFVETLFGIYDSINKHYSHSQHFMLFTKIWFVPSWAYLSSSWLKRRQDIITGHLKLSAFSLIVSPY